MAKDDLENVYNGLADEAEEGVTRNILRPTCRAIARMRVGSFKQRTECVITKSVGTSCASVVETLNRWREHYETMLNNALADICPDSTRSQLLQQRALTFVKTSQLSTRFRNPSAS